MTDQYTSASGLCGSFWQIVDDPRIKLLSGIASVNEANARVYDAGIRNIAGKADSYTSGFILTKDKYVISENTLATEDDVPLIITLFSQDEELLLGVDFKRIAEHTYEFAEEIVPDTDGSLTVGCSFQLNPSLSAKASIGADVYQSEGVQQIVRSNNGRETIRKACMELLGIPYATKTGTVLSHQDGVSIETSQETVPYVTGEVHTGIVQAGEPLVNRRVRVFTPTYDLTPWWRDSIAVMHNCNTNWFSTAPEDDLSLRNATTTVTKDTGKLVLVIDSPPHVSPPRQALFELPCTSYNADRILAALGISSGGTASAIDALMYFFGNTFLVIEFTAAAQATKQEEAEDLYRIIRPFLPCSTQVKVFAL